MATRVTVKGQVTIPAAIRKQFGIQPHDSVEFQVENDRITLIPVVPLKNLRGAVKRRGPGAAQERSVAKRAAAARVREELS